MDARTMQARGSVPSVRARLLAVLLCRTILHETEFLANLAEIVELDVCGLLEGIEGGRVLVGHALQLSQQTRDAGTTATKPAAMLTIHGFASHESVREEERREERTLGAPAVAPSESATARAARERSSR